MRVVAAGLLQLLVYPVGERAAPSPRCSRRQPCRAYPGGFNPDPHGSTFQAEPLAAALNTGYCLLPNRGIGIAIPRAVSNLQCGKQGGFRAANHASGPPARLLWLTASIRTAAISAKVRIVTEPFDPTGSSTIAPATSPRNVCE